LCSAANDHAYSLDSVRRVMKVSARKWAIARFMDKMNQVSE
jgi:hypothetical protein